MARVLIIIRIVFVVLTIYQIVYLNTLTNSNTETIADFKYKIFKKIQSDSLDSRDKADMVITETNKFINNSTHIQMGVHQLMGALGLWAVVELGFFLRKRNGQKSASI